jgi:hypothetical protein
MPFENLNNVHYSATEKAAVDTAFATIEATLTPKYRNVSAEERQKYGSVNETNKLIVGKVHDFRKTSPALCSPDVDWVEFQADYDSREFIENTITRLEAMVINLNNNKILHDFDNYSNSLTDYGFSQYKLGTKAPGFAKKVAEIGQFFSRTAATTPEKTEEPKS